ncbi:MAG: S8 family serine peptidase [Nanoarchaeota archaeon]|nr:S8 family serine peptidase [Nanoarchaeota archaeon]
MNKKTLIIFLTVFCLLLTTAIAFTPCPDELTAERVKKDLKISIIDYFKHPQTSKYSIDEIIDMSNTYKQLKENPEKVDCGTVKSSGKDILTIYEEKVINNCFNKVRDKDETGIDCGGSCLPCTQTKNNNISDSEIIKEKNYVPGEIIVKLKDDVTLKKYDIWNKEIIYTNKKSLKNIKNKYEFSELKELKLPKTYTIKINNKEVEEAIKELQTDPNVEFAQPDYLMDLQMGVDDSLFSRQWNLEKMRVPDAWDISTGDDVTIAILDSGLLSQMSIDETNLLAEFEGKIIDGWNFWDWNNDIRDSIDYGCEHGTRVAGVAVAKANNDFFMAGVCPECKILPIKVCGPYEIDGEIELKCKSSVTADAIVWIKNNQLADIISMSFGSTLLDAATNNLLEYVINDAYNKHNILLVAAAGNNNNDKKIYPAAYDNVIAVAATNKDDSKWSGSNYGSWIDISAPTGIVATGCNSYITGTSGATPEVAGILGLLKSAYPDKDNDYLTQHLLGGADNIDYANLLYKGKLGAGRVNALKSLTHAKDDYEGWPLIWNNPLVCSIIINIFYNGDCFDQQPFKCSLGSMVSDCEKCGCPEGKECAEDGFCYTLCADGTRIGSCSNNAPLFCSSEGLVNNCKICDCPEQYPVCSLDNSCHETCSDGTDFEQCSITKPKFCGENDLMNNCQKCGCPRGFICDIGGSCKKLLKTEI